MKISYKWLKDYIDIDLSIEELAQKITDSGVEVEEIIPTLPPINNVVLAKVESLEKHPDADKLNICKINNGSEVFQVICGAPNVKEGQHIPFAMVGALLPNGLKIKKAKIRGVESYGMVCSKEELGIEEKSEGIWPLDVPHAIGTDINTVLEDVKDYIFDLFITSNRPDCLSHYGIAREVAAFTAKEARLPKIELNESPSLKVADSIKVDIEYPEGCPRYAARVIKGVKVGPSPQWLVEKLEAIGSRSINNIVDITNFVLNEVGQPMHAFDLAKIKDKHIIVKNSQEGNKFITLDEKERVLPKNTVMICDAEKEVAIGGIMGGFNSEVSETTQDILLESAFFNYEHIVLSTRKLSLYTDASQRFEKGTDVDNVIWALDRAAQLIQDLAGGEIAQGIVDCYPEKVVQKVVPFNPARVNRVLGSNLSDKEVIDTLNKLNLKNGPNGITVPSYRVDINQEIDLVEEVARLINLDNLPTSVVEPLSLTQEPNLKELKIRALRSVLIELGLSEIFTNSMVSTKDADSVSTEEKVKIINPISDDLSTMRPNLVPGMMDSIAHNKNRTLPNVRFFEMGRIFISNGTDVLPEQPHHLAMALSGARTPQNWNREDAEVDYYDIKGLIEDLFTRLKISAFSFIPNSNHLELESTMAVDILVENRIIGKMGKISDSVSKNFAISDAVYYIELNTKSLLKYILRDKKYKTIGKYPYIEKDLALLLDKSILSSDVITYIKKQAGKLLTSAHVFDMYEGEKINKGLKSLAIRLTFQSDERTLSDKEVDKVFKKIITHSKTQFNATLRDR